MRNQLEGPLLGGLKEGGFENSDPDARKDFPQKAYQRSRLKIVRR